MISPLTGKTILVVEDNPRNMKLIRTLLSLHQCAVVLAADAEAATAPTSSSWTFICRP